jgi:hypothetical protein
MTPSGDGRQLDRGRTRAVSIVVCDNPTHKVNKRKPVRSGVFTHLMVAFLVASGKVGGLSRSN